MGSPTADFDADFRPTTDRVSWRWESIARARRDGRALPPIAVIERLGQHQIDAWASPAAAQPRAA